jgi:hypothetical protein
VTRPFRGPANALHGKVNVDRAGLAIRKLRAADRLKSRGGR